MTASLPPVQPASPPPAAATPSVSDSATPDVPFKQVLSGEMAQQRSRASDASKAGETDPGRDARSRDAQAGEDPRPDSAPADSASGGVTPPLLIDPAAATTVPDTATPAADALLALAMNPALQKPDATRSLPTEDAPLPGGGTPGNAARTRADAAALVAEANTLSRVRGDMPQAAIRATDDAAQLARRADPARTTDSQPDFVSALNQLQAGQAQLIPAPSPQAVSLAAASLQTSERLAPGVGTAAWNQALGEKIVWMVAGAQQSATLTLNPPDLGPLQVVLNVSNEQASAHFMAAQPEVRQALEAALPRLRDMMQDAGIQLGQANVSADTPRQQDTQARTPAHTDAALGNRDTPEDAPDMAIPRPVRAGRGLVDTFA